MKWKERLTIFLKGCFMGLADIVPGVSGGTIALITGIYSRLIEAIRSIDPSIPLRALQGDREEAKRRFGAVDLPFLVPLGAGMLGAFLLASFFLDSAVNQYPEATYSFFFGLILASAVLIFKRQNGENLKKFFEAGLFGFLLAFWITGLGKPGEPPLPHTYPVIFFSGALAICAMVLPGISGAFVLLLLGQWEKMVLALRQFTGQWPKLLVFGLGGVTSILAFSRLVSHLLKNYRDRTMGFLAGLMVGALRRMFGVITSEMSGAIGIQSLAVPLIFGAVGALIVAIIEGGTENRTISIK